MLWKPYTYNLSYSSWSLWLCYTFLLIRVHGPQLSYICLFKIKYLTKYLWNLPSAFLLFLSVFTNGYFFHSVAIFGFRIIPFSNKLFSFYFFCPILQRKIITIFKSAIAHEEKNKELRRLLLKLFGSSLGQLKWKINFTSTKKNFHQGAHLNLRPREPLYQGAWHFGA